MNIIYFLLLNSLISFVNKNVDKKIVFRNKEIPLQKVLTVLQILEMAMTLRSLKMPGKLFNLFRFMKTHR